MATPTRFKTESKYKAAQDKKANARPLIFAIVGDGSAAAGAAATVGARPGGVGGYWIWIRLVGDNNRVTQCFSPTAFVTGDMIFVRQADDRNLSYYEFAEFVTGAVPPVAPHNILSVSHADAGVNAPSLGSIIKGVAGPLWNELVVGTAWQILQVNAGATDFAWVSFDWDNFSADPGADMVHDHSAAAEGGQLDWDNVWSDAVHDHSAAGEGGQLDWDNIWSDAVHDHSSAAEGGQLIDLNGAVDALVLDGDGNTSISAPNNDQIDFEIGGADDFTFTANSFNVLSGSVITLANNVWIGLGAAAGRLEFDSAPAPDEIRVQAANLDLNNNDLLLDANGDSYLHSSADDVVQFVIPNVVASLEFILNGVQYFDFRMSALDLLNGADILCGAGSIIDLNGNADALVLDADGDTSISSPTDDIIDFEVGGSDEGFLFPEGWGGENFAFRVRNNSGAAAAANDVGYIDENGQYLTTATQYNDVAWCVVVYATPGNDGDGDADDDIWIASRGRVTVQLDANCNVGDYLYTSGTATQASVLSYVRPEVFAVARTANAAGVGGTCEAVLLCGRVKRLETSTNDVLWVTNSSASLFAALINEAAPVGIVVDYDTVVGNEDSINVTAATQLGKLVLHNTTRGDSALISSVNTGANQITLTAAAPAGWQNNDAIQVESLTAITGDVWEYFDVDISGSAPALATAIICQMRSWDSVGWNDFSIHPYEAYALSKRCTIGSFAVVSHYRTGMVPLINGIFCAGWAPSGVATGAAHLYLMGWEVAVP